MIGSDPLVTGLVFGACLIVLSASIVTIGALAPGRRTVPTHAAPRRERQTPVPVAPPRASWLSALAKTRGSLGRRLLDAWTGPAKGEQWLRQVEEIMIGADVGVKAAEALVEQMRPRLAEVDGPEALRALMRDSVAKLLAAGAVDERTDAKPLVILVVGVNGVGKTTTIGKLAHRYRQEGRKVILVAADTFRAAATEQLALWAERVDAGLVKHQSGADPSAVAFDGVQAAQARGADVVLIDTAGRLHVKSNLMEEVKKVARTIARQMPDAPHQVLLVIDATTGQNGLTQAREFREATDVTGVVLTKLDGSAKGGIVFAIETELGIPVKLVGIGESIGDLIPFDPDEFVDALF